MNEEEFEALLKQVDLTDADQFWDLCQHMANLAEHIGQESADPAWLRAARHLKDATAAVANRMGN